MAHEFTSSTVNGVDFSGPGMKLLVRAPDLYLAWVHGGNYWSGVGVQSYAESRLAIIPRNPEGRARVGGTLSITLAEGGRLTAKRVLEFKEKIDEYFGEGTAEKAAASLKRGQEKTVVVDGGGNEPDLIESPAEARKRREAEKARRKANPPPKTESMIFTEAEVDRLMDSARASLEGANDEEGQKLWEKLSRLKKRFSFEPYQPPKVPKDFRL